MKKVLSLILAVAMVAAFLCPAVFAAGSKEFLIEVAKTENIVVTEYVVPGTTEEEIAEAMAALDEEIAVTMTSLDEEGQKAFAEAGLDVATVSVTVVTQMNVEVEPGKKGKMSVEMEGVEDVTIAVFLKLSDGTMKLLKVGVPPLEVEPEESGILVVTIVE